MTAEMPVGSGADATPERLPERLEILSANELGRTIHRLASQVLESVADSRQLILLGIPTRGVALARVLAERLEAQCGHPIACGSLDPTFHRDDLERVGTRLGIPTELPESLDGREVVLVDDVMTTGQTLMACAQALQTASPKAIHAVVFARAQSWAPTKPPPHVQPCSLPT